MSQTLASGAGHAPGPVPHPLYARQSREAALLMIRHGEEAHRLPFPVAELDEIACEMDALRAQGVGPRRAGVLLARLNAGDLRAIDGGGESVTSPRPSLRLV